MMSPGLPSAPAPDTSVGSGFDKRVHRNDAALSPILPCHDPLLERLVQGLQASHENKHSFF